MSFFRLFRLLLAIRKLTKVHDAWPPVYRAYLMCMGVLVLVAITQYLIDMIAIVAVTIFGTMVGIFVSVLLRYGATECAHRLLVLVRH